MVKEFILRKNVFVEEGCEHIGFMVLLGMHICSLSLHIRYYLS